MLKHIICHIHTLNHPSVLKLVRVLVKYNSVFTGEKIATVTKITKEIEIYNRVCSILKKLGYTVFTVENDELRETKHFFSTSLPHLLSKTKEGILYYCHSKGITYHPDSEDGKATSVWTDTLLKYTLENYETIPFTNKKYKTFGSCRVAKKGFLPDDIGENYSYVGTFFWIRLESLLNKQFFPKSKFYLEGLPGLVSTLSESYNAGPVFLHGESPYKLEIWKKKGIYND